MHYTHRSINTHSVTKEPETGYVGNKNQKILLPDSASKCKETPKPVFDPGRVTIPSKGVIEQKNALQERCFTFRIDTIPSRRLR